MNYSATPKSLMTAKINDCLKETDTLKTAPDCFLKEKLLTYKKWIGKYLTLDKQDNTILSYLNALYNKGEGWTRFIRIYYIKEYVEDFEFNFMHVYGPSAYDGYISLMISPSELYDYNKMEINESYLKAFLHRNKIEEISLYDANVQENFFGHTVGAETDIYRELFFYFLKLLKKGFAEIGIIFELK